MNNYENGFGSTDEQVRNGFAACKDGRCPEFDGVGNENIDMKKIYDAWHEDWLLDNAPL